MVDQTDRRFSPTKPPASPGPDPQGVGDSSPTTRPPTSGQTMHPASFGSSPAQAPPPPPPLPPSVGGVEGGAPPPSGQVSPLPTAGVAGGPIVPSPPKRVFPKRIILIIVIVLLTLVVGFFAWRNLLPKIKIGGRADLTWWGLWEEESVVAPLIAEYQEKNPNVKVKYVQQSPQDYRERLTNALAKGEGPDIFRFHNTWVPMFARELDSVPASVMNSSEYATTYYPVVSSDMTSGTGLVGIPLGFDALTLYINEDIFATAGKSPPTTWDELRKTAIELTVKNDEGLITQAGVALGNAKNVDHWPEILALMMIQNGVNLEKPEGKLAEDALSFYTIFASKDGVWDETLPPSTLAFANGKVAMYLGTTWRTFEIKRENPDLRFRTVALPQLPKDTPDQPDISYATYWVEGVWKRSSKKDAAWTFLEFLSRRESLEKMYQAASSIRLFGELYPRVDMEDLLIDHPIVGSVISQAAGAKSWYLASRTFDGPTGINSQIISYFEDAVNAVNSGEPPGRALQTAASGVTQVLSQHGLLSR